MSFAGSEPIPRQQLAYGLCPTTQPPVDRTPGAYSLCQLQDASHTIIDTQVMTCRTCVEQRECVLYNEAGEVVTSSVRSCELCQWQCLTWGTRVSDCASMSFAGSERIPRTRLAYGVCPSEQSPVPKAPAAQGLCQLQDSSRAIIDTQRMTCRDCVEQCATWEECAYMVFNTEEATREQLDGYCECVMPDGSTAAGGGGRKLRAL